MDSVLPMPVGLADTESSSQHDPKASKSGRSFSADEARDIEQVLTSLTGDVEFGDYDVAPPRFYRKISDGTASMAMVLVRRSIDCQHLHGPELVSLKTDSQASGTRFIMCAFTACQSAVFACMICCLLCSRIDKLATVLMPCAAEQRGLMQNWLLSQRVDLAAVLMYLLIHWLYIIGQAKQSCDSDGMLVAACAECMGGLFNACLTFTLLRFNRFILEYVNFFARKCQEHPDHIPWLQREWTRISAFTSAVSAKTSSAYLFIVAFSILGCAPAAGKLLSRDRAATAERCDLHWVLPSVAMALTNLSFATYLVRSAALVTDRCKASKSLANYVVEATSSATTRERQALCFHIDFCNAAIRINGTKINGAVLMRMLSLLATVGTGVMMELASDDDRQMELHSIFNQTINVWTAE